MVQEQKATAPPESLKREEQREKSEDRAEYSAGRNSGGGAV
jgi:hypothetical protein